MTAVVIYIHGFLSSPQSRKCIQSQRWFEQYFPEVVFYSPQLSSYPDEANTTLHETISLFSDRRIYAIGSSLGGFWATYLLENRLIEKAVLVNPGVLPQTRFREFIGRELKSYYTEDSYILTEKDINSLEKYDYNIITDPHRYWLMVQTGDETLDYRLAVDKYADCKQLIEKGGNHSFAGYENHLPEIAKFFDLENNR